MKPLFQVVGCFAAALLFSCSGLGAQTRSGSAGSASPAPAAPAPGQAKQAASPWEGAADGQAVTVSGTLRLVGNEPFSRLVITDSDGHDWVIDAASRKALSRLETKAVRVSAILRLKPQILANGKRLPDLRELSRVRLLE